MNDSEIIKGLDPNLKDRILDLVYHKNRDSVQNVVTIKDLEIANEYASINLRILEETGTNVIELIIMNTYDSRVQDMHIVELYNKLIGSKKEKTREQIFREALENR